jgi:hypothetical protein
MQVPVPLPRSSSRPRRYSASHSSVVALVRCSTLGKIKSTLHLLHPWSQMQPLSSVLHQDCVSLFHSGSHNGKSVGYSFRQKWCQHLSFLRQPFSLNHQQSVIYAQYSLHKAKFSPNLRLVKCYGSPRKTAHELSRPARTPSPRTHTTHRPRRPHR